MYCIDVVEKYRLENYIQIKHKLFSTQTAVQHWNLEVLIIVYITIYDHLQMRH